MLSDAVGWVEGLAWVRTLRTSPILYPLVSGTHILTFGTMIGALAVHHIAHLRGRAHIRLAASTLPIAYSAFAVAVLTGATLITTRLGTYLANPAIQVNAALIALALVNAAAFHAARRKWARGTFAIMSLALWVSVLMAGRWAGFV